MKKILFFPFIFLIFFYLFPYSHIEAAIVINEVYPKTEDPSFTWIEVYNTGSENVSLDRWQLVNSSGQVSSFTMNASSIIHSQNFLTFSHQQTGINLNKNGDTITLKNEKNEIVDTQGYPSTLGFNTSMGKSVDGDGLWTICTNPTKNSPNNCLIPPTSIILNPTAVITTPIPTDTLLMAMGATDITKSPTPTDTPVKPTALPTPLPTSIPDNSLLIKQQISVVAIVFSLIWVVIIVSITIWKKSR